MKSWSKMSDIEKKEQLDELYRETEKRLKTCPACGNESIEVDKDNRQVTCNHCKNDDLIYLYGCPVCTSFRNEVIVKSEIERCRFCTGGFDEMPKDKDGYAEMYLELGGFGEICKVKSEKEMTEAIDKALEKLKKQVVFITI